MALTEITYTGDGSDVTFGPIPFDYLEATDVKVSLNGVITSAFTIDPSTKIITFSSAPGNGVSIRVFRRTDFEDLSATFISGSAIRAQDLNDNFNQNLYVTQEISNYAITNDGLVPMKGDLNMGNYRITNLAEPTAANNAATKQYIDTRLTPLGIPGFTRWSLTAAGGETTLSGAGTTGGTLAYSPNREQVYLNGAQLQRDADYTANNGTSIVLNVALTAGDVVEVICVNNLNTGTTAQAQDVYWNQSGTGAATRTVESKLRDVVSVKDFGAVGDGVTDDTAAIQAALDTTSKAIYFPQGTYRVVKGDTNPALTSSVTDRRIYGEGAITATSIVRTAIYITGARTQFSLNCSGNNNIGVFVHIAASDCQVTNCRITDLYSPASTGSVNGVRVSLNGLTGGVVVSDNYISQLESVGDLTAGNGKGLSRAALVEADSDLDSPIVISNNTIKNVIGEEGDAIAVISDNGAGTFYRLNLVIQNNTILNFTRRGIKIQCSGARIIGNTFRNAWSSDQGNMQGVIDLVQGGSHFVVNNILDNCKYIPQIKAIEDVASVSDITVASNIITGIGAETSDALIYLNTNGGSNVTVSNNTILCSGYAGNAIGVLSTDKVFIDGNRVDIDAGGTPFNLTTGITNLVAGFNQVTGKPSASIRLPGVTTDSAVTFEVNNTTTRALTLTNSDTVINNGEIISQLAFNVQDDTLNQIGASVRAVAVGAAGSTALDFHCGPSSTPDAFAARFAIDGSFYVGGIDRTTAKFGFDVARGALIIPSTTVPTSPSAGWLYFDSSAKKLKVYSGTAWETVTST